MSSTSYSGLPTSVRGAEPVPPAPEPPHSILPVSILVYNQYADTNPGGEYEHTMAAINNTYGTDYYYTDLTDYTNLASELPNHDILLIVEQEQATVAQMKTVGTAWATTLTNFVQDGGIVILLDYAIYPWAGYVGITFHIYNSSGLMQINGVSDEWLNTIYLANTSDALARNVASSWTAPDGSISFNTPETTIVVDNSTNDPVVVHKIMDKGHIVLLGFDFYTTESNCEELLGNAIRLHRHVVFSNFHSPYGTIFNYLSSFADDLVTEGFAVSSLGAFSSAFIEACDVLVLTSGTTTLTAAEADAIEAFVLDGGGLFVATDWGAFGDELDPVTTKFGFTRYADYLTDTDDTLVPDSYNLYDNTGGNYNIVNHSITVGVTRLELDRVGGFSALPTDAVPILFTDTDGTSDWSGGSAADGVPMAAALVTAGNGRVSAIMDWNFLNDNTNPDSDGDNTYFDSNNDDYAINTIRWLSAAGLKERIILFEESHSPGWPINAAGYRDFSSYLTSNGYTIHWMSTFYPSLLDQAHILVICDGSSAYSASENASIVDFVAAGGGLLLLGDNGGNRDRIDPISNVFGLDWHDTDDLEDSDDYIGSTDYVIYDGANIGTHAITQGVSRIEINAGTGMVSIGSGTALVSTDTDGSASWGGVNPANGVAALAATTYQLGRVVCITDFQFFQGTSDFDGDGISDFHEHDNILLTVNTFQWLSENRAPVVTVTYPNGGETLTGTVTISWTAIDPNKDPVASYDVYYSPNSGGSWTAIATGLTTTSTSWDTTTVTDGSQYLVRVVAHDYELNGQDQSDADFSITNLPPPIPGFPFEAVALGLLFSMGLVFVIRRRRRHNN
ncbi:MAG: hypothetical protein ACFFDP_09300 [Promethearchaeota archaeon]